MVYHFDYFGQRLMACQTHLHPWEVVIVGLILAIQEAFLQGSEVSRMSEIRLEFQEVPVVVAVVVMSVQEVEVAFLHLEVREEAPRWGGEVALVQEEEEEEQALTPYD